MVEVEKRAKLSKTEYEKLYQYLTDNGLKLTSFGNLVLSHMWRDDWKPSLDPKVAPFDLKISTGGGNSTITIKGNPRGNMHTDNDFQIDFSSDEFGNHLDLLVNLNFKRFIATSEHRTRFKYKEFNIALFHYKNSDTWMMEVERKTGQDADPDKLEKDIDLLFEEMHLHLLDGKEVQVINDEISEVDEFRVDFNEVNVTDWLENLKPVETDEAETA